MSSSKKIKLFFIITKGNFGGAQRYVYDLATGLPKDKYEITVITGAGNNLDHKLETRGIRTLKINTLQRNINPLLEIKSLFFLIKLFYREKPDIIHLNSSKAGGLGSVAGRITGVSKIIFTGHGWTFNERRNSLSKILIIFFHWLTIVFCHQVIAVSNKVKEDITQLPFIKQKIVVIYNGIDNFTLIDKEIAKTKLTSNPALQNKNLRQTTWLGTIAELHQNKGLDIAINALAAIIKTYPHLIYVIIGEGEEKARLEKLIQKLSLTNNVFLLGFIDEARQYLSAFDIFLLPSRTEALPYTVLEAGLAGLPTIASAVGGIQEIIENGQSGQLVHKENSTEIAEALQSILKNPELRSKYGQNLQQTIKDKFSLEEMIQKTEVVYEK